MLLDGGDNAGILGGTAPLKSGSAKNAQNLVRLTTTFDIERKYL